MFASARAIGERGVASATSRGGDASAEGQGGVSVATEVHGSARATGETGVASTTGAAGSASVTGKYGVASATGDMGCAEAENPESVAVAWGYHGKAKGVVGSHLVFAELGKNENYSETKNQKRLKGTKMVRVDGGKIKENVWYTMTDGEVVEVE